MAEEKAPSLEQVEPLSDSDIRYFIRQMDQITGSHNRGLGQVQARMALEQIRAVRRFEQSSEVLGRRLNRLTFVLVALTLVLAAPIIWQGVKWLIWRLR